MIETGMGSSLLIMRQDSPGGDTTYYAGDVVSAQPDGHPWSPREAPPQFYRLSVPDLPISAAHDWLMGGYDDAIKLPASLPSVVVPPSPEKGTVLLTRRLYKVRLDGIAWAANGEASITHAELLARTSRRI